jgi:hypothetical protein
VKKILISVTLLFLSAQADAQPWDRYDRYPYGGYRRFPGGDYAPPGYINPRQYGIPRDYGCCGEGPNIDGGHWSRPEFWDYRAGRGGSQRRPMYRPWWDR